MAIKTIRLIEVNDQKVETSDFSSFEKLADYASEKSGTVRKPEPGENLPKAKKKKLITNKLQKQVQSRKAT